MASKCKCGNTESYNFALNIGLCNPCIGERLEELEADKENLRQYASGLENAQNLITVRYRELEAENVNWKQRYIEAVNNLKQALKAINS